MFTLDIPYVPAQETPIVLAQANAASASPQPDFILNDCQGTASAQEYDGSALRSVDPAGALFNALNEAAGKKIVPSMSVIKNVILLETTKHGELLTRTASDGRTTFRYKPITDYVGKDRAVFMVQYGGKHYKIVVNLEVSLSLNNYLCPDNPYKLEKVTKPSSGFNGYDINFIVVNSAKHTGSDIGQTVGNKPSTLLWTGITLGSISPTTAISWL